MVKELDIEQSFIDRAMAMLADFSFNRFDTESYPETIDVDLKYLEDQGLIEGGKITKKGTIALILFWKDEL